MKKVLYISSHYSRGNSMHNIRKQMDIAKALLDLGYYPLIPLLLPFYELAYQDRSEDEMLEWELGLLEKCDGVVRIRFKDSDGIEIPSSGADKEVKRANDKHIAVYDYESIEEMKNDLINQNIES